MAKEYYHLFHSNAQWKMCIFGLKIYVPSGNPALGEKFGP
jgi:hypothetical protein